MQKLIKIGTRKSLLALAQSNGIKAQIEAQYPEVTVELVKIMTKGDKILDVPLAKVGGKGLFVKELEEAMLSREVDLAVHSMKDVPAELPDELHLALVTKREDPRDAFISNKYKAFADLPQGAKIGTSSLRRRAQLAKMRPDLVIDDLRGNLDTRLRKLDEGQYDAIILAAAGLNRLQLARATSYFTSLEMLPAVGQGAVGIEMRRDATELLAALRFLDHRATKVTVQAERAFLLRLEFCISCPTIQAYMREMGIFALVPGPHTSQPAPQHQIYLYLLRNVTAMRPNHIWGIHITYIRLEHGWLYLTAILDWYSRNIVSWALSQTLEMGFVLTAVDNALFQAKPEIWNSDQGSHFTSPKYLERLQREEIKIRAWKFIPSRVEYPAACGGRRGSGLAPRLIPFICINMPAPRRLIAS